jgi:hypothetical protein
MEPSEALSTAAQIAVALAGFAGVVVVFRRESVHEWSPIDKFRLRLLLTNSIHPLSFCMIGLLLLTIKPAPPGIWRWCSGLTFAILLPFAMKTMKTFRHFDPQHLRRERATGFIFYLFGMGLQRRCYNSTTRPFSHVLAILHRNRRPTRCRHVPVCANHSPSA